MIRLILFIITPLSLVSLGGCASLDDVVGGISNTPEWFQQRRVEIRGEGYPKFADVPERVTNANLGAAVELSGADARRAKALFESSNRAATTDISSEEIATAADGLRERLPTRFIEPAPPIVSPAEVDALRRELGRFQ